MSGVGRRLLLVDDDEQLVALLAIKLRQAGYVVEPATRALHGYERAAQVTFDLIILDIIMPELSGLEVCKQLRLRGILTPILILSGETDKDMIVRGLNAGADDYLTKPFSGDELVARVRALLRRSRKTFGTRHIERYGIDLDMEARRVRVGAEEVILTQKESMLLKRLMAEAPDPVPRWDLLRDVWGISGTHASNRLDVYIRRLRKKLAAVGDGSAIHTVRGDGYRFGEPD